MAEIKQTSKIKYQRLVRKQINLKAFEDLIKKQKSMKKGSEIKYNYLQCQSYLQPHSNISVEDQRLLFSLRVRMNKIPFNFPGNKENVNCETNCGNILNNEHILICEILNEGNSHNLKYEHIFNGTLNQQIEVLYKIKLNLSRREQIITQRSSLL